MLTQPVEAGGFEGFDTICWNLWKALVLHVELALGKTGIVWRCQIERSCNILSRKDERKGDVGFCPGFDCAPASSTYQNWPHQRLDDNFFTIWIIIKKLKWSWSGYQHFDTWDKTLKDFEIRENPVNTQCPRMGKNTSFNTATNEICSFAMAVGLSNEKHARGQWWLKTNGWRLSRTRLVCDPYREEHASSKENEDTKGS